MKTIPYGRVLAVLFTFLAAQVVGGAIAFLVSGVSMGVMLFAVNAVALVAGLISRFARRQDWTCGQASFGVSLQLLIGIILLCMGLNLVGEPLDLPDYAAEMMVQVLGHPLGFLAVTLLGPITEEVFFRSGIMGASLRAGTPARTAIIVSAVLFGLIHGNPAQVPFAICIGLALGYAYLRTGSLLVPIVAHIVNNGTAGILYLLMDEETFQDFRFATLFGGNVQVIVVGLLLTALGLYVLLGKHFQKP